MKQSLVVFSLLCGFAAATYGGPVGPAWMDASIAKLEGHYATILKAPEQARLHRGLRQLADFWRAEDGDAAAFEGFVIANFSDRKSVV
jgi:hypothetical protein